jgi:TusA-related sulfurtransferase
MRDQDEKVPADKKLDLSGEVCPYTFVKSKLAMESMAAGQVIRITLDNSESASNVPRSIELEGHEVLAVDQLRPSVWSVTVRKQ